MPMPPKLQRLYEALDKGDVYEQPVVEQKPRRRSIYGYCHDANGTITINPVLHVLDTLVHELFHRMNPSWSERTVKRETTKLIRALSPEEQQALYDHYQIVKQPKRRKKAVQ